MLTVSLQGRREVQCRLPSSAAHMVSLQTAQRLLDTHESAGGAQQRSGAAKRPAPRQRRRSTAGLAAAFLALAVLLATGVHSEIEQQSLRRNTSATMLFNMQTGDADTLHVMPRIQGCVATDCSKVYWEGSLHVSWRGFAAACCIRPS